MILTVTILGSSTSIKDFCLLGESYYLHAQGGDSLSGWVKTIPSVLGSNNSDTCNVVILLKKGNYEMILD